MTHSTQARRWSPAATPHVRRILTVTGTLLWLTTAGCNNDDPPTHFQPDCEDGTTEQRSCGVDGEGSAQRTCHHGRWVTAPCELPDGRCLDGERRAASCAAGESGAERCVSGQWIQEQACSVDPNGTSCTPGKRSTTACGWNQRGEQALICDDANTWQWSGPCDDPDECVDGKTRAATCLEFGTQQQRCESGSWVDEGPCEEPCPLGERQTEACGFNGRGTQEFLCADGAWQPQAPCDDPDVCENGAVGTGDCALSDLGEAPQTCADGRWDAGLCRPLRLAGSSSPPNSVIYSGTRCALRRSGRILCWGSTANGVRGTGDTSSTQGPSHVDGILDAVDIAIGFQHACAVHKTGDVSCWGTNADSQLGPGASSTELSPRRVEGITDAVGVAAGVSHTCVLRRNGEALCWGANDRGQLGDGTISPRATPKPVLNLDNATRLVAAGAHTCAILSSGKVACWGANNRGQLGDDSTTDRNAPVIVPGLSGVTKLALSSRHSCAVASSRVRCWGDNALGIVGHSSIGDARLTPWTISSLNNVVDISAAWTSTCALTSSGDAYCWGSNAQGEYGNGTVTPITEPHATHVPQKVQRFQKGIALTTTSSAAVLTGGATNCALNQSGALYCWGMNAAQLLGKPTPPATDPTPGAVPIPAP